METPRGLGVFQATWQIQQRKQLQGHSIMEHGAPRTSQSSREAPHSQSQCTNSGTRAVQEDFRDRDDRVTHCSVAASWVLESRMVVQKHKR